MVGLRSLPPEKRYGRPLFFSPCDRRRPSEWTVLALVGAAGIVFSTAVSRALFRLNYGALVSAVLGRNSSHWNGLLTGTVSGRDHPVEGRRGGVRGVRHSIVYIPRISAVQWCQ